MAWLQFLDLSHEQKVQRRNLLDRYGIYAQLSVVVPVLIFQLFRLARWVHLERRKSKQDYAALPSAGEPGSPVRKHSRLSYSGLAFNRLRLLKWWLGGEVFAGAGQKGFWLGASLWAVWLLSLCLCQTGHAASQFPVHYALALKSPSSPFALAFGSSHERLNAYHRVTGRIIYSFLVLHAAFYFNFFVQAGVLQQRMTSLVPLLGVFSFLALTLLIITSIPWIRRWSYRVFFVLHLVIGVSILPVLFFHAPSLRIYIVEALILFVLDIAARKLNTLRSFSQITSIPHTKLLKVTIPVAASKLARFRAAPGQHIYLSVPRESRPPKTPSLSLYEIFFNPFSVASVSENDITLVLRALHGPVTTALNRLTDLPKANPPVNIEGPYGEARRFPNFAADYDRVLLVAGGVGGTFILPVYQRIVAAMGDEGRSAGRVTLIWSMRSLREIFWVEKEDSQKLLTQAEHVKVFLTGELDSLDATFTPPEDGSIEMGEVDSKAEHSVTVSGGHSRPDLRKIVDDVFQAGQEDRVAVLVCGPPAMARELRTHVGRWVYKGRTVWFHNEAFGW